MLTIFVLGCISLLLRASGFFLMGYITVTPRVRRMLDALPGCVIVSAVAPVAWHGGLVATVAVVTSVVAMYISRSDFIAMFLGVGAAAALRALGFGG
jgi:uncharacterized membrane protein